MTKTRNVAPGEIIGYRKDGRAIRLIAGGSQDAVPPGTPIQPLAPVAGEPVQPVAQPVPPVGGPVFTAEQVEEFRRQEREKLYGKLSKGEQTLEELKAKLAEFKSERERLQREAEELRKAEEEARRRAEEEELSARELLERQRREMEEQFAALRAEREAERAALEKEKQFASLQAYIQRRVREEQMAETIAPELLDLVNGNTEEEVEQSIQMLREKTSTLVSNFQAQLGAMQPPQQPRGVSPAGYAATGPMDTQTMQRQITPEELRDMPISEWAKVRHLILGDKATQTRGNGLFG